MQRMKASGLMVVIIGAIGFLLLTVCQGAPAPILTKESDPTQTRSVIATAWTAEITGKLVISDGCLRITNETDDYALVWPPDYSVEIQGEMVKIKTSLISGDPGEILLTLGDSIHLSGGETQQLGDDLHQTLAPGCSAPFWVVGYEVVLVQEKEP